MSINKYSQKEFQIISDNYDHSLSVRKNANIIAPMLDNRNSRALQNKLSYMKNKNLSKSIVAKEVKIEKDFYSRLAELITKHASDELKEKIFISILSS